MLVKRVHESLAKYLIIQSQKYCFIAYPVTSNIKRLLQLLTYCLESVCGLRQ